MHGCFGLLRKLVAEDGGRLLRIAEAGDGSITVVRDERPSASPVCWDLSPSGELVAAGAADAVVEVIYAKTGVRMRRLEGFPGAVEAVRFARRPLSERRRILDLAQMNASIGDGLLSASERLRAFARYTRALPFRRNSDAIEQIVRASLERRHRWKGEDCLSRRRP